MQPIKSADAYRLATFKRLIYMQRRYLTATTFAITVLLTGCASAPDLIPVPFEAPPESSNSTVFVYRSKSVPMGVYARIEANGERKSLLPDDHLTWFQVAPGKYRIEVHFPALVGMDRPAIDLVLDSGKIYYIRYDGTSPGASIPIMGSNGQFLGVVGGAGKFSNRLTLVGKETADGQMQGLSYVPATPW